MITSKCFVVNEILCFESVEFLLVMFLQRKNNLFSRLKSFPFGMKLVAVTTWGVASKKPTQEQLH